MNYVCLVNIVCIIQKINAEKCVESLKKKNKPFFTGSSFPC